MPTGSQWWKGRCTSLDGSDRFIVPFGVYRNTELTGPSPHAENSMAVPIGTAGSLMTFRVKLSGSPGAGNSYRFQLSLDSSASTVLDVTISGAETYGSASGTVAVTAGQALAIKKTVSGTPTSVDAEFDMEFMPTTANYYCYFFHSCGSHVFEVAYDWPLAVTNLLTAEVPDPSSILLFGQTIFPLDGTVRSLYVRYSATPTAAAPFNGSRTLQVNVAGTNIGSSVTVGASTTGNVTGMSAAISAGDLICVGEVPTSAPPPRLSTILAFCVVIESTLPGVWAWMSLCDTANDLYMGVNGSRGAMTSDTEASLVLRMPTDVTVSALWVARRIAPGLGASSTFRFRVNAASVNLVAVMTDLNTKAHDTSHTDVMTLGDTCDVLSTDTGIISSVAWTLGIGASTNSTVVTPPPGGGSSPLMSPFHPANLERFQRQGAYPNPPLERTGTRELFSPKRERF